MNTTARRIVLERYISDWPIDTSSIRRILANTRIFPILYSDTMIT